MSRTTMILLVACFIVPTTSFNLRQNGQVLQQANASQGKPKTIYEKGIPDPTCKTGVMDVAMTACCTDECEMCGNHKLCDDVGAYNEKTGKLADNCCKNRILKADVSCDENHPPCVLSPSYKKHIEDYVEKKYKRHAMQDCTKAEAKARLSHACGIEKGEYF